MFENEYFYTDIEKMFQTFCTANTERINLLYTQILHETFKRDPTLTVEKDIDIYSSRQNQIKTIKKKRTLRKAIKKLERK
jgi:hypothetical protein